MRRMPRAAVGVLLAIGVAIAGRWASGQTPNPRRWGQPAQVTILDVVADPISSNSLDAQKGELSLPIHSLPKPAMKKVRVASEAPAVAKLPVKWGKPTDSWETQVKKLEALNVPRAGSPNGQDRPTLTNSITPSTAPASVPSGRKVAQTRAKAAAEMTWHRPGNIEESEPKTVADTEDRSADVTQRSLLRSERHWPPAYAAKTTTDKGRPGVIQFEEASPRESVKAATSDSLDPAILQKRVQSLCGKQARAVSVAAQGNGTLLVTVKVDSRSIEDKLSLKILALPEMTAPKVRWLMNVDP